MKCDMYSDSISYLLKVVYGQPDLPLGVVDTTQVAPGHSKVRLGLYSLHVTRLEGGREGGRGALIRKPVRKNVISTVQTHCTYT